MMFSISPARNADELFRPSGVGRKSVLLFLMLLLGVAFAVTDYGGLLTESVAEAQQKKRQGVFQRLFRPRELPPTAERPSTMVKPPRSSGPRAKSPTKRRLPQAAGTRTLCIRTCDGYYFPISHSATRKRFKIDEAVCKAMYGGAVANLYYHDNGSSADTAVSLKGKPLAREPYAFAFRNTFSESCQAELKNGLARLGAAFIAKAAKAPPAPAARDREAAPKPLPQPAPRVIAGTDPETLVNRAGSFVVAPVLPPDEAAIVAALLMRKVGSAYYYDDPVVIATLREPRPRGPEFTLIGSALADQPDTYSPRSVRSAP